MRNHSLSVVLLVAALGLSACSASTDAPGAAPPTVPATPEATPAPTVAPVKVLDPERVKAEALENGRPVAAWDIDCIAWETPQAGTKGQEWANKLGADFLDNQSADCPDAITYPYYYIESFEPGTEGELIVTVEQDMNRILHGPRRGEYDDVYQVALGVLDSIASKNPSLKRVTAQLPNGDRYGTANLGEDRRPPGGDGLL